MSNLSDPQLVLLSAAAQRSDRIVVPPADAEGPVVAKLFKPLLKRRLIEEVPTVDGYPVFRRDREGDALSLRITDDGLAAIGIDPAETGAKQKVPPTGADSSSAQGKQKDAAAKKAPRNPTLKKKPKGKAEIASSKTRFTSKSSPQGRKTSPATRSKGERTKNPQPGSKQALLIAMLQKKQGADIDAIVKATDWLPHTARAAISGLRQAGFEIELERKDDAKSVYRIVGGSKRSPARKTV